MRKNNNNPLLQMRKPCKGIWRLGNLAKDTRNEAFWLLYGLLPSTFVPYKYSNTSTLWETSLSNLIYLEQIWGHRSKQKHFCNWNGSKAVSERVCIFSRQSRARTARLRAIAGPFVKGLEPEHLSGTWGSQCNHWCFQVIHKVNFSLIC